MNERIKIKEIAKLAGVSVATISRALNCPEKLKDITLDRVLKAIKKYNYIPNYSARNLSKKSVETIDVILNSDKDIFESEYHLKILSGIVENSDNRNINVIIQIMTNDMDRMLKTYYSGMVYGLILIAPAIDCALLKIIHDNNIPVVLISSKYENFKNICMDNECIIKEIFDLLKKNNYKKIAFITGNLKSVDGQKRFELFKKYTQKYEFEMQQKYIGYGDFSQDSGYVEMKKILSLTNLPEVVFASNDLMASGAYRAIQEKGLSIPGDIGVIGFDDLSISKILNPPLTTVTQNLKNFGIKAVDLLFSNNEKNMVLKGDLVLRNSVKLNV